MRSVIITICVYGSATKKIPPGEFIFQKAVAIEGCATADEVAAKVHALEHQYFPQVIEQLLKSK